MEYPIWRDINARPAEERAEIVRDIIRKAAVAIADDLEKQAKRTHSNPASNAYQDSADQIRALIFLSTVRPWRQTCD